VIALAVFQGTSWILFGRRRFSAVVGRDVVRVTQENLFVDERSVKCVPLYAQENLRSRLLASSQVFDETDRPSNRKTCGDPEGGRVAYTYDVPHFHVKGWSCTPLTGRVDYWAYRHVGAAKVYRILYLWILGVWVRRSTANPIAVS